nr:acyltransferase family protein [Raoultella ornithinolytica]
MNGLRFIAVFLVVAFHFKIPPFVGGYMGVDIFFVISGFLMHEICTKDYGVKKWMFNFYKKRFDRIYPALIAMVIFSFLIISASESPSGLKIAVKQAVSAVLFLSNIFYWKETSGYFSGVSESYWFLHTWSLSVEWQFYLIFPFFFFFAREMFKGKYLTWFYLFSFVISFSLCVAIAKNHQNAAFYLLPTRAWELLLGGLVASLSVKNKAPRVTEIFSLMIIMIFSLYVKEGLGWPGGLTLIPTLAAAAIIHANIGNDRTILRFRPFQYIGAASYSIYLFHWPVVSYIYNNNIELNAWTKFIALCVSVLLGVFSYKYLERWNKRKTSWLFVSAIGFIIVSSGAAVQEITKYWSSEKIMKLDYYQSYSNSDMMQRQFGNKEFICFLSSENNDVKNFDTKNCLKLSSTKKNILLIGDSHAAEIALSMKEVFSDYNVLQATSSGCMPYLESSGQKRCRDLVNYIYDDFLMNNNVDAIFIAANWVDGKNENVALGVLNSIRKIKSKTDKVFVIGQTKVFDMDFFRIAQKENASRLDSYKTYESVSINNMLSKSFLDLGLNYINVFDVGCSKDICSLIDENETPYMFDTNHLTKPWADKMVRYIKNMSGM